MTKKLVFIKIFRVFGAKYTQKTDFFDFRDNWVLFAMFVVVPLKLRLIKYMFKISLSVITDSNSNLNGYWPPLKPRCTALLIFTVPLFVIPEPCAFKISGLRVFLYERIETRLSAENGENDPK